MLVGKVMSSPVISVTPATTIRMAAELMRDHSVGGLPVFQDDRLVGIITDRDIVVRALAAQGVPLGMSTEVAAIMSDRVITCFLDKDVEVAAGLMGEQQVRRLLVVNREGAPVGILSVGDIAEHVSEELAGQILGEISEARAGDAHR
ncbi:MAG: CBS domain-containing protein [Rhodobacteraceae bacterium]|nr:CBS domain-containing protein [Paracoccaceae bacterium]